MNRQTASDSDAARSGTQEVRRDALNHGIGERPIRRPANDALTSGSPWALPPWPTLEIGKWIADRLDRHLPGRGNRALLASVGPDPQARLTAVTHQCVLPALRRVWEKLAAEGHDVEFEHGAMRVALHARRFNGTPVEYAVEGTIYQAPVFSLADLHGTAQHSPGGERRSRIRIVSRGHARECRLEQCSEAAMYRDALHELRNQMLV